MEDSTNEFDLMYLTNNLDYKKVKNKFLEPELYDDVKFYRKRIEKQIEDLLNGKNVENQLDNCFKRYLFLSIQHFKFIDKRDIIQKEYEGIKVKKQPQRSFDLKKMDKMLEKKKEKIGKITDSLDIKIHYKNERKVVLPQKKVINLKDEMLKTKGLEKKECEVNISINDIQKKNKEKNKTEKKKNKAEKIKKEKKKNYTKKVFDGKMFSKR